MSIDLLDEDPRPLAQEARDLPRLRGDRPVDPSTLWRWHARGLRGVKLEIVRVGGTACTSKLALRRFFERVEAARQMAVAPPPAPSHHPTVADRAADELAALGI
jgi:hypothetical protein